MFSCCKKEVKQKEEKVEDELEEIVSGPRKIFDAFKKEFEEGKGHEKSHFEDLVWKFIKKEAAKAFDLAFLDETCIDNIYVYGSIHTYTTELFATLVGTEVKTVLESKSKDLQKAINYAVGKPRTVETYQPIWNVVGDIVGFDPKVGFPTIMDKDTLKRIILSNTFITAGLSHEHGQICFNATSSSKNHLTATIMSIFSRKDFAVSKVMITDDFKELSLFYKDEEVKYDPQSDDWNRAVRCFFTCVCFMFELMHAVLHVFAFVTLSACIQATAGTMMEDFIKLSQDQILVKYLEVKGLLLGKDGLVVGGPTGWPVDKVLAKAGALVVFKHFASVATAEEWQDKINFAGLKVLKDNPHVLQQCRAYPPLFTELAGIVDEQIPTERKLDINAKLQEALSKTYMKGNGHCFAMTNIKEWIQISYMVGLYHGNTLNITRMIMTPWVNLNGHWDTKVIEKIEEVSLQTNYGLATGTILGLDEERQVNNFVGLKGLGIDRATIQPIQDKTTRIQLDFWDTLSADEKEKYGWIYSIWGPNMTGKMQLTVSTYV